MKQLVYILGITTLYNLGLCVIPLKGMFEEIPAITTESLALIALNARQLNITCAQGNAESVRAVFDHARRSGLSSYELRSLFNFRCNDKTALMSAIEADNVATVKALLTIAQQEHMSLEQQGKILMRADNLGMTPLLCATARAQESIIRILFAAAHDIKMKPYTRWNFLTCADRDNNTALMLAVHTGNVAIVEAIIHEAGAIPVPEDHKRDFLVSTNIKGDTALMQAVQRESIPILYVLLSSIDEFKMNDASVRLMINKKNAEGHTILTIATAFIEGIIKKFLEQKALREDGCVLIDPMHQFIDENEYQII